MVNTARVVSVEAMDSVMFILVYYHALVILSSAIYMEGIERVYVYS